MRLLRSRIHHATRAADDSSIVVTSEPKSNGSASLIATQMGLQTNELNGEAKSQWSSILGRLLEGL